MRMFLALAAVLCVTPALADGGPAPDAGAAILATPDAGAVVATPADAGEAPDVETKAARPETAQGEAEPAPPAVNVAKKTQLLAELRSREVQQTIGGRMMGFVGCGVLLLIALALSENRKRIDWKLVGAGTAMQFAFAVLVLKTAPGKAFFQFANDAIRKLLSFSEQGARFVFGGLVGNSVPVLGADGQPTGDLAQVGSLLAFGIMPTILFFSALSAILYYLGVLQLVVRGLAWIMQKMMRISGAESLAAAANVFVGQTEAPLTVRPFLEKMTRSELMALMTGGFATVAGGVLAVYVGMLKDVFPDIAGHLLAASVMSAPASFVMAKIIVPETETPETAEGAEISIEQTDANLLDAASRGTSEGLLLALNVAAMLITFMALIPMLNWVVQLPGIPMDWLGFTGAAAWFEVLTLEQMLGWVLGPLAFLMGVPWVDAMAVGTMLGTKTIINEFVAYLQLAGAMQNGTLAHGKSVIIATYALCGFSNLASIGIQIGGLSVLVPSRRGDLARLGFRAMVGASLACFQTAALAGILL